jgi:hypothetical protein
MSKSKWYVAELIVEIRVEDDVRNIVHRNLALVEANSADNAYERTTALGRDSDVQYKNPAGRNVRIQFRGISKLAALNDELEHGAELLYEEHIDVPEQLVEQLVTPKDQLTVFRDVAPSSGPDYSSAEILEEALDLLEQDNHSPGAAS